MIRGEIIDTLRKRRQALAMAGIEAMYLFGSRARGDDSPESDIDIAFDAHDDFTFLDQARVHRELTDLFGRKVDLVERAAMRPLLRKHVERDLQQIF